MEGLNLSPRTCLANALAAEPSPWASILFIFKTESCYVALADLVRRLTW